MLKKTIKIGLALYSTDNETKFGTKKLNIQTKRLKECNNFFKKNLLEDYMVDIFFHGWNDVISSKVIRYFNPIKFKLSKINFDKKLIAKYKMEFINYYDDVADLKIRKIEPLLDYNNFVNKIENRFLSQTTSLSILEDYKIKNKINYDYIISSRYDLIIKKKIDLKKILTNKINTINNDKLKSFQVDDIFFVGKISNLKKLKYFYKNIRNYPIGPTRGLYYFFKQNKILINKSFQNNSIISGDIYYKYFKISFFEKIIQKTIFAIVKTIDFFQINLRKVKFFLYKKIANN